MRPFEQYEEDVEVLDQVIDIDQNDLMVFNDEINTFDFVINSLMEVIGHTPEQAEQCTLLIHYKGKCSVKKGTFEELVPLRNDICRRGIDAKVI